MAIAASALALYPGALEAAIAGTRTGGDARNRVYLEGRLTVDQGVPAELEALCFDPQTSGGLLAAVDPAVVDELAAVGFALIGAVVDGPDRVKLLP